MFINTDLEIKVSVLRNLFAQLQATSGRNAKQQLLEDCRKNLPSIEDDLVVVQECLDNKHPVGYTYPKTYGDSVPAVSTIRQLIEILEQPIKQKDLSQANIAATVSQTSKYGEFLEPIINRSLRLGIRLAEDVRNYKPMLACNARDCFDENIDYIIQEKLDGNRCIAVYDEEQGKWTFTSRNGKPQNVDFDMGDISKAYVYDGEILTRSQTALSIKRERRLPLGKDENEFQALTGKVNSNKAEDKKDLVYNIYDVMIDAPCRVRQDVIHWQREHETKDVRFINNLGRISTHNMKELLDYIVSTGGEGLILRDPEATYVHDRAPVLLKVKKMQTMDMECFDTEKGTGRNADRIGKLVCRITTDKGEYIEAKVGSGLDDSDRDKDPSEFIGKIIEVQYFEITKAQGREGCSLRHPVFLGVRTDKDTTSEH